MSVVDELRKLAELKNDGLITDNEYQTIKATLIGAGDDDTSGHADRDAAFFTSALNGWLSYRQEANKQLLILSSGALALLVGTVSPESQSFRDFGFHFHLVLWCAVAFFACLSASLLELKYSPPYLKSVIHNDVDASLEKRLEVLERISNSTFWLGAVGLFVLVFYNMLTVE